ncbi:hypothetical protein H6P81_021199 [Aristolochia fimbriata]|uniref:Uncharacterized protein n=1 Tax=Aristolochia fimbriata TaxID=158543 RepID=A0AAV7DTD2_ARIFI|nr:hypothetical protein H6P81_021646 [Aristolochia fimbriata]KAG9438458.1 hypothetical protein H6P81_021599 [Aristolochia fimbriata]KAG9438864.1 hypothetical protein H6P81_021162 [Aristolochia fimbriata]KAG9438901.1 hypothetical protein H6P81_021199 [Aristolochia fimbriata]
MNLSRQQALGPQQCASGKSFLYNVQVVQNRTTRKQRQSKLKNPTLAGISLTSLLTKVRKRASGTVLSQPWEGTTKDMFFRMSGFSGEGSRMCCAGQAMHIVKIVGTELLQCLRMLGFPS